MVENTEPISLVAPTSSIVAAYVTNNKVSVEELPDLIRNIHESFHRADQNNSSSTIGSNIHPATSIK